MSAVGWAKRSVPTTETVDQCWWARRKGAFAHPTDSAYAALTLARKPSTALRSMPDWLSSSRAFDSTSEAALPVASAAAVTPPIWELISFDPAATDWMLRAISRVASPCCSIAVEMPIGDLAHLRRSSG